MLSEAKQSPIFNRTIRISAEDLLQIQRFSDKPQEVVMKRSMQDAAGQITTKSYFRIPLSQALALADALSQVAEVTMLDSQVEGRLAKLFRRYGSVRVESSFDHVRKARLGMPEAHGLAAERGLPEACQEAKSEDGQLKPVDSVLVSVKDWCSANRDGLNEINLLDLATFVKNELKLDDPRRAIDEAFQRGILTRSPKLSRAVVA